VLNLPRGRHALFDIAKHPGLQFFGISDASPVLGNAEPIAGDQTADLLRSHLLTSGLVKTGQTFCLLRTHQFRKRRKENQ
jgi:hypothetical protein